MGNRHSFVVGQYERCSPRRFSDTWVSLVSTRLKLLRMLADGRFHSGNSLGTAVGVGRAAVWKSLKGLADLGLEVQAVSGRGYRLARPIEPLDVAEIAGGLGPSSRSLLSGLEVLADIDSTNSYLMAGADRLESGHACFAEHQSGGRGRRGRQWYSPYGANILLSCLWRFGDGTARLSGLSLAVGVALIRALQDLGIGSAGLKWPNDVLIGGRKLAGILLEVVGEANGPCHVVAGIGLNFDMAQDRGAEIDQPWVALRPLCPSLTRNTVAGAVLHHLLLAFAQYEREGLAAFLEEWRGVDLLIGKELTIRSPGFEQQGIARGVDERGLLLVDTAEGPRRLSSGEVSIRSGR